MKVDVKENEAFFKISIDNTQDLSFSYAFNMTAPEDDEDPMYDVITTAITILAGIVSTVKDFPDQIVEIGEQAIESGEFNVQATADPDVVEFMENLSDEEIELLETPTGDMH